jgi:thiosulfate/3-mercaptopyruvate sulfurtransferase
MVFKQSLSALGRAGTGPGEIAAMAETTQTDSLVQVHWLIDHLTTPHVRIIDVRGAVRHVPQADGSDLVVYEGLRSEYDRGHIPGAVFVDWTTDITDPDDAVPVQVASAERLSALFGSLGLTPDDHVVVYDEAGASIATRLWWVFTYAGHQRVSLLDGGIAAWQAAGFPVTTEVPTFEPTVYPVRVRPELRRTAEETLAVSQAKSAVLIDARAAQYYRGEVVRSGRAGHIPGAVNVPSTSLFKPEGGLRSDEELRAILAAAGVDEETPVVAYCGGGVTATSVLFALDRLGHRNWSNYDGSWNEWGPRQDLPAASALGVSPRG